MSTQPFLHVFLNYRMGWHSVTRIIVIQIKVTFKVNYCHVAHTYDPGVIPVQ